MGSKLYNQISSMAPGSLSHLQAAVFGLGDPAFREWYQGGPRKFSKALEQAGAWSIVPMGLGSIKDVSGYVSALDRWLPQLADILRAPSRASEPTSETDTSSPQPQPSPSPHVPPKTTKSVVTPQSSVDSLVCNIYVYVSYLGTAGNAPCITDTARHSQEPA